MRLQRQKAGEIGRAELHRVSSDVEAADRLLADASVDLVTSAFGFRNLANYHEGLTEILRVLRPGGAVLLQDLDGQFVWNYPQDEELASQVVRRVVGREPVLTPESGRMNVPLATADAAADVLIGLRQAGLTITSVSVAKPTLDEVFLALTGHESSDAAQPDAAVPTESLLEVR